jgi:L,D-peptidoglycan transpeptidase YkuD (ErfK/YbiS/YcfS/YnhG family)
MLKRLTLFTLAFIPTGIVAQEQIPWTASRQVVLVVTPSWTESSGVIQWFESGGAGAPWRAVVLPMPVIVGKTGLAWGRGLHPQVSDGGPIKREGDLRAPAGAFRLSSAFGYAKAALDIRLPYVQATTSLECVDDPRSQFYNRIVDRTQVAAMDWKSSEQMRRRDELYQWGIVIDHNDAAPTPGFGSCVFMHVWRKSNGSTVGCTAMSAETIKRLLSWLDPAAKPVLIQLPRPVYERLRQEWHLPVMRLD